MGSCTSGTQPLPMTEVLDVVPTDYVVERKQSQSSVEIFMAQRRKWTVYDRWRDRRLYKFRPEYNLRVPYEIPGTLRLMHHVLPPHILCEQPYVAEHHGSLVQCDLHLYVQWPMHKQPPRHVPWRYGMNCENLHLGTTMPSVYVFEPPDNMKGQIARAVAFAFVKHRIHTVCGIAEILPLPLLLEWHENYHIDVSESDYHTSVEAIQKDGHPFLRHPEWIREHFCKQPVPEHGRRRCSHSCCLMIRGTRISAITATAARLRRRHSECSYFHSTTKSTSTQRHSFTDSKDCRRRPSVIDVVGLPGLLPVPGSGSPSIRAAVATTAETSGSAHGNETGQPDETGARDKQ